MTDNLEDRSADPGVEEVLDEIIDLEEYAKLGKRPPLSKGYRILVNGDPFVVNEPNPTGRAILTSRVCCPPSTTRSASNLRARNRRRLGSTSTSISAARAWRSSRRCRVIRRRAEL